MPRERPVDPDAVRQAESRTARLDGSQAHDLLAAAGDVSRLKMVRALDGAALPRATSRT